MQWGLDGGFGSLGDVTIGLRQVEGLQLKKINRLNHKGSVYACWKRSHRSRSLKKNDTLSIIR